MSPTQRTLKRLREAGYHAEVVEKYNSFSRTRKDFLNIIDVIAIKESEILGVQTTSGSNVNARQKKCENEPLLKDWEKAGGKFEIHGWRKLKKKGYQPRIVEYQYGQFKEKEKGKDND
jgi:predicted AAA+ superfamily ATPase